MGYHDRRVDSYTGGHAHDHRVTHEGVVEAEKHVGGLVDGGAEHVGVALAGSLGSHALGGQVVADLGVDDPPVAGDDQGRLRLRGVEQRVQRFGDAGRSTGAGGRRAGRWQEVVEVEVVDAAVAPYLFLGGGQAGACEPRGRRRAPAAQPVGAVERGARVRGERAQRLVLSQVARSGWAPQSG
jgi:hypothetical protein